MDQLIVQLLRRPRLLAGIGAGALILIAYCMGVASIPPVDHAQECAEEIISIDQIKQLRDQCYERLSTCETRSAGDRVIRCHDECDIRIAEALAEAKAWTCGD